jgi:hypothetical protein
MKHSRQLMASVVIAMCATTASAQSDMILGMLFGGSFIMALMDNPVPDKKELTVADDVAIEYRALEKNPRTEYLKECQRYGFNQSQCVTIWDGTPLVTTQPVAVLRFKHKQPLAPTDNSVATAKIEPLADVDNQEYKQRREQALKKPNAFVEHITIQ